MKPEITDEIRLIGVGRFEASSSHEEKDYWVTYFVASAHADRGLVLGGMEAALGIELHVHFEFWSEIMAQDQAGEPTVWPFVGKLITDFVIHAHGTKFLGEFDRQEEILTDRSNSAADGIVWVVQEELGEG